MRVGFVHVINHMLADLRMKLGPAHRGDQSLAWMPLFSWAKQWDKHRNVTGEQKNDLVLENLRISHVSKSYPQKT